MALDFNNEINILSKTPGIGRYLAIALRGMQSGVNSLGENLAADPTNNTMPAPPPIQRITVKSDGSGNVHAVIDDSSQIKRGINYFVEYSTDPSFKQPHVVHLNASRTMSPIPQPAKDDNGDPQVFHFRGYSQYRGGDPGQKVVFGGNTPTPVDPGGSAQATLLPSTGSGTAPNHGQSGGEGLGRQFQRKQA